MPFCRFGLLMMDRTLFNDWPLNWMMVYATVEIDRQLSMKRKSTGRFLIYDPVMNKRLISIRFPLNLINFNMSKAS